MNYALRLKDRAFIRLTGAVYTPIKVAAALTQYVSGLVPSKNPRILEPSVGDGAFIGSLAEEFADGQVTAVDIDADVVSMLDEIIPSIWHMNTSLVAEDFITFACDRIDSSDISYNLVIGNPPFIRKHNFSNNFKAAIGRLSERTGYPVSALKNSWAAFLMASTHLLQDDGVLALIIPYELMTVAYGHQLLDWLANEFQRIDLFVSNQKAFPEIDQDAIIFIGQKQPTSPPGIFIQRVKAMDNLDASTEFALDRSAADTWPLELNRFLIPPSILPFVQTLRRKTPIVSDHCTSSPGIVTAANEFFILTESRARELNLDEHTLPILKKGSFAGRLPIFSSEDFEAVAQREPCRFLRLQGPRDTLPPSVTAYLDEGEKEKLHQRYKCRNRANWYEVPIVTPTEGFVFKRSHGFPRLCLNEANVYITDTAYGIKMRNGYSMRGMCFSFYNSFTLLFAEIEGRFYGGGVLELSPKEFRRLPLVYHEPTDDEFEAFLAAHAKADGNIETILDFGDAWMAKKLALSDNKARALRKAWATVRSHRLRHGAKQG